MHARAQVLVATASAVVLFAARPAAAAIASADVAADSELILHEQVGYGTYHDYTVSIHVRGRRAVLVAERDGVRRTARLPLASVLSLWTRLLGQDIDGLASATPERMLPDQSSFRVEYRVLGQRGGFSAYAVDSLSDARYRTIVRDVLQVADTHVRPRWGAR